MGRRALAVAAALVMAPLLAATGCNADGAGSPGPGDLELDLRVGARVELTEGAADPDEVTVDAGEMVEFTNAGGGELRVVGDDSLFDSGGMRPGETFLFLFEEAGRFGYTVSDGRASGTVVVTAPSVDAER